MPELELITKLAEGLTATLVLIYGLWAIITGKLKTQGHHDEVIAEKDKSLDRALATIEELTDAQTKNNAVLEKFSEALRGLTASVESLRSTIESQRSRR